MAKKTLIERMLATTKGGKTALAVEALIEQIEFMNSAEGFYRSHFNLTRRSAESRIVLKALKVLRRQPRISNGSSK